MRFGLLITNHIAMKKARYLAYLMVLLNACSIQKPYHQRLNHIPLQGPNFGVEILLADKRPTRPYFEVIELYLKEKGRLSKSTIMKKLEMEAIKEGVDAIMEIDYWNGSEEKANVLTMLIDVMDDDHETTYINAPYTHISGIGVKYLENIDYLDKQPEFEYVYLIDPASDMPEPLFKIEYNPIGQEHKIYPETAQGKIIYDDYLQFYSDYHLLHQRERWFYTVAKNKIKKRILYDEDGYVVKTCILNYDPSGKLETLKVYNRMAGLDIINYHYEEGKLKYRMVHTHDQVKIFTQYNYEGDKLSERKIKITLPTKKHYLLTTSIIYYDPDYLKDYYYQEYAKTQNLSNSE